MQAWEPVEKRLQEEEAKVSAERYKTLNRQHYTEGAEQTYRTDLTQFQT